MEKYDYYLASVIKNWLRSADVRPGTRSTILRKAASERMSNLSTTSYTPAHLQAWNLPGRKSGTADLWQFRFGAVLAPFHSGSLKLVT